MQNQTKLNELVDLVIKNTVAKNVPTVIFLSDIEESLFLKKTASVLLKKEYDETVFTPNDWNELADIILKLANIPLVIKMNDSVETTLEHIKNFGKELELNKGYVIIDCGKNKFPDIQISKLPQNIVIEKI